MVEIQPIPETAVSFHIEYPGGKHAIITAHTVKIKDKCFVFSRRVKNEATNVTYFEEVAWVPFENVRSVRRP